jgi:hypothetical protein
MGGMSHQEHFARQPAFSIARIGRGAVHVPVDHPLGLGAVGRSPAASSRKKSRSRPAGSGIAQNPPASRNTGISAGPYGQPSTVASTAAHRPG